MIYWFGNMMGPNKANGAGSGPDLTSHYSGTLYTGDNAFPRTISTPADSRSGLLWGKARGNTDAHQFLIEQGASKFRTSPASTGAFTNVANLTQNASSVDVSSNTGFAINGSAIDYVLWSMKKQAGFMDRIEYTGNATNRTIAHNLGVAPKAVIIRGTGNLVMIAGHDNLKASTPWGNLYSFDVSGVATSATYFQNTAPSSSVITLGTNVNTNGNAATFTAYLFADDNSTNGLVRCGFWTGNGSASGPSVNLGWPPRWLMVMSAAGNGGAASCSIFDSARGFTQRLTTADAAESTVAWFTLTASGFTITTSNAAVNANLGRYCYIAIR